jgi:hypothetical protein
MAINVIWSALVGVQTLAVGWELVAMDEAVLVLVLAMAVV